MESRPPKVQFVPDLLSILVPVYNEEFTLEAILEKLIKLKLPEPLRQEIIIVDDASTDSSPKLIEHYATKYPDLIRAFSQPSNKGKGAAIRRAISEIRGEFAIFQDADLEYDPDDYSALLKPLLEGVANVVYGSRFASRSMRRVFNYYHSLGNHFLTTLSNLVTGLSLTDMETCYKVFRSEILITIPLRSNRFGMEPELTAKIAKRNCTVYEVPINYHGRSYLEGKKIGWKDGVSAIYTILKYWLIDDCFEDNYGRGALSKISEITQYSRWVVERIWPFLGGEILEVGSGIGNVSRLLPKRKQLILADSNPTSLKILANGFRHSDSVAIKKLDLAHEEDIATLDDSLVDTIICLNTLERLKDDTIALSNFYRILKPGGQLILLVPQYPSLFGDLDRSLHHQRRYTRKSIGRSLTAGGFSVKSTESFNFFSIPFWWFNNFILNKKTMSRLQLKVLNQLIPFLKHIDKSLPLPGLSLLVVGEKRKI